MAESRETLTRNTERILCCNRRAAMVRFGKHQIEGTRRKARSWKRLRRRSEGTFAGDLQTNPVERMGSGRLIQIKRRLLDKTHKLNTYSRTSRLMCWE